MLAVTLCTTTALATGCSGCEDETTDNNANPANTPPVASISAPEKATVAQMVQANGSASTDADGDPLTYTWSLEAPDGSSSELDSQIAETVSFTGDEEGDYVLTLIVNDGKADSEPVTATVDVDAVGTENQAPVADIVGDTLGRIGQELSFDGSSSSDPDGDDLTYTWSLTSAPTGSVAGIGADNALATLTPDMVGMYEVTLTVSDGELTDEVSVSVMISNPGNTPPKADAGRDQSVELGETVNFDGSMSGDVDGDPLTFSWEIVDAPLAARSALIDPDTATPSLVTDAVGFYEFELTVSDGEFTDSDRVRVQVTRGANNAPVADAGPDQNVLVGTRVTLDGTGSSDPDGDAFTYKWSFTSDPSNGAVILNDSTRARATFRAREPGVYTVELTITDSEGAVSTDTVDITVEEPANQKPNAEAGADSVFTLGSNVTLNGLASSDVEDDAAGLPLSYSWVMTTKPSASSATLSNPTSATPSFVLDEAGDYIITLTVTDSKGLTDTDSVKITSTTINNIPPLADAGPDQTVTQYELVTLDGSGSSDLEDDLSLTPLTYTWLVAMQPIGSNISFSDPSAMMPTFTPSVPGNYVLSLRVTDSIGAVSMDSVIITVNQAPNTNPVANAGSDLTYPVQSLVTLNGTGSTDVEDDATGTRLIYSWVLDSEPAGSSIVLSGANTREPTFTPVLEGDYTFTLTVTDSRGGTSTDTVTITAVNMDPLADAGPDQTVSFNNPVTLDGSGSRDTEDGGANIPLTYQWVIISQPSGSNVMLTNAQNAQATFTPMELGSYTVELTVTDSAGASDTDQAVITVTGMNTPPVANAGDDRPVSRLAKVELNGSDSFDSEDDANGIPLTYNWVLVSQPNLSNTVLNRANEEKPDLVPDQPGLYVIELTVTDSGGLVSNTDTVTIEAFDLTQACLVFSEYVEENGSNKGFELYNRCGVDINLAPFKVCIFRNTDTECSASIDLQGMLGPDQVHTVCNSGLDTSLLPPGITCDRTSVVASFNGDDRLLIYADQDGDDRFTFGDLPIDAFGEILRPMTFPEWENATYRRCNTDAYEGDGTFPVDRYERVVPASFEEFGLPPATCNFPPEADAGMDRNVFVGETIQLDGTGSSDIEDTASSTMLGFAWSLTSKPAGSSAMLSNTSSPTPDFTPDRLGDYVFTLTVIDSGGKMSSDTVTITAKNNPPTANAGPDQLASTGTTVTLEGMAQDVEDDALGITLTYAWSVTQEPAGSNVTISNANQTEASFVPTEAGDYIFTFTVTDSLGLTSSDTTLVTVSAAMLANAADDLFISEYVEGTASNKVIELYNRNATLSMNTADIYVCLESNATVGCGNFVFLGMSLGPKETFVVCNAGFANQALCDVVSSGVANFNGDDRILVYKDSNLDGLPGGGDVLIDAFGDPGVQPGSPNPPLKAWENITAQRSNFTRHINQTPAMSFSLMTYYTVLPVDTFCGIGLAPEDDCP